MAMPILQNEAYNVISNSLVAQYFGYIDADTGEVTEVGNIDVSELGDYGKSYDDLSTTVKKSFFSDMGALVTDQIFVLNGYITETVDITKGFGNKYTTIIQKNRMRPQRKSEEQTSFDMEDGSTTDPYVYHNFEIESTYFMDYQGEQFKWSIPDKVFKGFTLNEANFKAMVNMISENIQTEITKHIDLASQALINQTAAIIINDNKPTQVINILKQYNDLNAVELTMQEAITVPEFNRFAIYTINNSLDQLASRNTLNNYNAWESQTTPSNAHLLFNSTWINGMNQYLLGDTFNVEFMKLPTFKKIYAWQGAGSNGDLESNMTIDLTIKDPATETNVSVTQRGILGMIFNKDAVSIYNPTVDTEAARDHERRVTNYFTDLNFSTMIDLYEDFVVYLIDDSYLTEVPEGTPTAVKTAALKIEEELASKTKAELISELNELGVTSGLKSKTKSNLIKLLASKKVK